MTHRSRLRKGDRRPRHDRMLSVAAGVLLSAAALAACSPSSDQAAPTSSKQTSASSRAAAVTTPTTAPGSLSPSSGGGSGLGFDGASFQAAMAQVGVPASGPTSGTASTGVGTTSYSMVGSGTAISSITCRVSAMGGTPAQSDADAQILANPFLVSCATWSYQGPLATEASTFVTSNLTTVPVGSPISQTIGPVDLQLGKDAAGQYFLTLTQ